jgi:aspartate/methionine/tyrosine aminotransferase
MSMTSSRKPSQRSEELAPFLVMEVLERAEALQREGRDIIHLEVGEPDFPTPECACKAAAEAMARCETHYTHSLGLLPLREAIAEYYAERYGVDVSPDRVVVTLGSSSALLLALASLIDPGDKVLLTNPYYPCYPAFTKAVGGTPVLAELDRSDGFQLHASLLARAADGCRALVINSPANPTGQVATRETLAEIATLGPTVISDEIYHGLVYEGEAHTILEFSDDAFAVDGFSKRYAMTGWRLGWLVAPSALVRSVQKWQQNLFICASNFPSHGGLAAIRHGWPDVERMRAEFDRRRQLIVSRLRELGFGIPATPRGAFYVLADARHLDADAVALSSRILEEAGVACTPGNDFGSQAHGMLRFSYANSLENITEAMRRLEAWLGRQ